MTPRFLALMALVAALTLAVALGLGSLYAPPAPAEPATALAEPVAETPAAPEPALRPAPPPATAVPPDDRAAARAPVEVAARPGRRNIAWNLAEVTYWATQQPFLDAMRTAKTWVGHLPGQWGGREEPDLAAQGVLDAQGWILRVPEDVTHLSTMVFVDMPAEMTSFAGSWRARWEGDARVQFAGAARNPRLQGNTASFDFSPGEGAVLIEVRQGSLRNLTLVHEDHVAAFDAGAVFHPGFLARIGDAENLRFMDWMRTNNSQLAAWDDRPRPTDYSYERRGVSLETMLALANLTGAEPWFTLPHMADDDHVRRFAQTVREGLRPDLRAWVEYSNEVWNFSFDQAQWAEQQARARWGREWAWTQFYTLRAAQVMAIWSEVFADSPDRLVRVVATQTGWLGLEQDLLEVPLWRAEDPDLPPPWANFDAYAVTGYFNAELHEDSRQPMIRAWLAESHTAAEAEADARGLTGEARARHIAAHRFDLAVARAGEELIDGRHSGRPEGTVRNLVDNVLPHHAEVARARGMALVMYEGGTHVVKDPRQHGDDELQAFYDALNHSEAMAGAYRELLGGWEALTEAPFNAFVAIGAPSIWGAWGALRHQDDDNPRWRVLIEMSER